MYEIKYGFIIFAFVLANLASGMQLRPNGINVCEKTFWYEGYVMKVSSYMGYENYLACCGLFCWKKCQKSRPVRQTYLKNVKERRLQKTYECCKGWGPRDGECPIPVCDPPCKNGICVRPNQCTCNKGYTGTDCSVEINECKQKPQVCDQICTNIPGSYICSCNKGFRKISTNLKDRRCDNVNECTISNSLCQCSNPSSSCLATCHDTIGSFYCACSKGYKLSGKNLCVDQNECTTNTHGCDHYCYNNQGKYSCGCKSGFVLNPKDGKTCLDINECLHANGGCEQSCQNKHGTYTCACRRGFIIADNKQSCNDINECLTRKPCDPTLGICRNTRGSFQCSCKTGFKLSQDGVLCEDIDECLTGNHGCEHKCSNLIGSYQCICPIGYVLSYDRRTCQEIDECKAGTHKCLHVCTNTVGSYTCKCRPGFTLNADGRTCTSKPCQPLPRVSHGKLYCPSTKLGAVCSHSCNDGYNLHGDKQRECLEGQVWSGRSTSCQPMWCPVPYPPQNGQLAQPCIQKFGSRCIVTCNHGYHLEGSGWLECTKDGNQTRWNQHENTCKVIKLCTPNPCKNQGKCYMISHSDYKCDCHGTGYIGPTCSTGIIQLPNFPTLDANKRSDSLVVRAKPVQELIIKPFVPNRAVVFHPEQLTITFPNTEVSFQMESTSTIGRVRIEFELKGLDAATFHTPSSTVVRITGRKHTCMSPKVITEDEFVSQCHQKELGTCSNGNKIKFFSSCDWNSGQTNGHISVGTDQHRVPFSIAGYQFPSGHNQGASESVLTPRSNVGDLNGKQPPTCVSGSCSTTLSDANYDFSIKNNFIIKSYLKQLSAISPWWFQLMINPSYRGFDVNNFQSLVYHGKLPQNVPACGNLPKLPDSGYYSVFAIKSVIDVQMMSNRFQTTDISASCVVLDLCRKVYYLSLPLKRSMDTTENLRSFGYKTSQFSMSGFSISTGESVVNKCMKLYEGEKLIEKCIGGNVWAQFSVIRKHEFLNLTFDGEVLIDVKDIQKLGVTRLDEPRVAIAYGDVFLGFQIPLAGGKTLLKISDKNADVYKRTSGGSDNEDYMTITTNSSKTRFVYNTPILTYLPTQQTDTEDIFQFTVNYSLRGGQVVSVINSIRIRSLLTYIYRSADRVNRELTVKNIKCNAVTYMKQLSRDLNQYTRKILTLDYKAMLQNHITFQNRFRTLKELLDELKVKIQQDHPTETVVLGRIRSLENRLFNKDLIPVPSTTHIKEIVHGFEMRYDGGFCVQKLCFKNCHFTARFSQTNNSKQNIQCVLLEDELLRNDLKVAKGTTILADISTSSDQDFLIRFSASISLFHQNVNSMVEINRTMALFKVQDFEIAKDFKFDINGEAVVTPLSTWESLSVLFHGRSSNSATHLVVFEKELTDFLTKNSRNVQKILAYYDNLYRNSTKALKKLELTKTDSHKRFKKKEDAFRLAESIYKHSLTKFYTAKEQFRSYQVNSYLRNYEVQLNKVCRLSQCPETCLGTKICQICQKSEVVNANILKCKSVKHKVRVTQQELYKDACNDIVKVYRNIYTGTCRTGGDVSEIRELLPNWGSGIGELIGGTTGAIIGALSGVVVGQFFGGCTDTWQKYLVKELATVPCFKARYFTKEEEWIESKCDSYTEKVVSKFGVPTSCNCSSQCVMTQEPSCLKYNNECRLRRQNRLKQMLVSAHVFNQSALEFMETEKELELASKKLSSSRRELKEAALRYNKTLVDYNQAVTYAKIAYANFEKASNNENLDFCLKQNWDRANATGLILKSQTFGSVSYARKNLDTILELVTGAQAKLVNFQLNTFDIESSFESSLKQIAVNLFCDKPTATFLSSTTYSPLLVNYNLQYSQADSMCNRVLELYSFIEYPINALFKLEKETREKRDRIRAEISMTTTKLDALRRAGSNNDLSKVDIQEMKDRLNELKGDITRYCDSNILKFWRNDMENFAHETNIMADKGVVDGFLYVEGELKSLVKYSGTNRDVYLSNLKKIYYGFQYFYFKEHLIHNLTAAILKQKYLVDATLKVTTFCKKTLSVVIDKPHRINVLSGDKITLTCVTDKHENIQYQWYQNKEPLPREHQSKLTFESRESATYRCEVETAVLSNVSTEVYVHVESRSVLHNTLSSFAIVYSEEKTKFSLLCNVSGTPNSVITWKYRPYDDQNTITLQGKGKPVLLLTKSTARSGVYYCTARNKHGAVESNKARVDVLGTCMAQQAFLLSFTVPRTEVSRILHKIFYSEDAKKAWSVSSTQRITLAITHHNTKSKVHFKLVDEIQSSNRCQYNDRTMVGIVATSKSNMVQLLRNVLKTMSVQVNENMTIAELREELRSTLLLEPYPVDICPPGYRLHETQYKCVQCAAGTFEEKRECKPCIIGFYQPLPGKTQCVKCPLNKTTEETESTSLYHCK